LKSIKLEPATTCDQENSTDQGHNSSDHEEAIVKNKIKACLSGIGIAKKVSLNDLRLNNFKSRAEIEKDSMQDKKL
jgi:hypothetical protein